MYEFKFVPEKCWYRNVCTEKCSSSCIRYMEMDFLLQNSGIPEKRQYPIDLIPEKKDYTAFCELAEIKDNIENFVNNGENLYITSCYTGNGKTSWAIKLLLKYFDCIWAGNGFKPRGLFINVPSFLTFLKNNISSKDVEFENFKSLILIADLVVWDDIASTALSQYDHSQLLTYIDRRILQKQSNIFTGNLNTSESLEKYVGARLTSRIWNTSTIIQFNGKDRR